MNLERFKQIVESYGAESARWPIDEAESARLFLSSSSNAQRCLSEAAKTDQYLDTIRVDPSTAVLDRITLGIEAGIEAGIAAEHKVPIAARVSSSPNLISRFIEWFTPTQPRAIASFIRPTLAACLPLVLGIGIGMNVSLDDESTLSSNEEIQLLALSQSSIGEWSAEEWSIE